MRKLYGLIAALALLFLASPALAASLIAQPTHNVVWNADPHGSGHEYEWIVFHGASGTAASVTGRMYVSTDSAGHDGYIGYLVDCGTTAPTNPSHSNQCYPGSLVGYSLFESPTFGNSGVFPASTNVDTGALTGVLSPTVALDPTHYYVIEFQFDYSAPSPGWVMFGEATSTVADFAANSVDGIEMGFTPFFSVNDSGGFNATTFSQISSIVSPIEGSTISVTAVPFSFWYQSDCSASSTPYDIAGANIQDNTTGQQIQGGLETTACGTHLFNETTNLNDQHSYTWTPFLYSTTASSTINGTNTNFTVNTAYTGTSTPTVTGLPGVLQNLWNMIQTNPPFGFIFQIRNELGNISASSTPAVSLTMPDFERTYVFNPMDLGLSSIMFFVFAVWAFKRFQHFDF